MKSNIHPVYYHNTKVICACGNTFVTGSVLPEIHVELCSKCHPFYTGVKKYLDTEGRLERFERKRKEAKERTVKTAKVKEAPKAAPERRTLKELLQGNK